MLKRILLSVLGLWLTAATSQAGIFNTLPTNEILRFEDNDLEGLIEKGTPDGKVSVGDLLLAVAEYPVIENALTNAGIASYSKTTASVMGVSLIQVKTVAVDGSAAKFEFEAASAADWATYTGLAGVTAGTAVIVFDDPPSNPAEHLINTPIAGTILSATDGTKVYELGFAGEGGEFQTAFTSVVPFSGKDPTKLTDINGLGFYAAFNLMGPPAAGAPGLNKINYLGDSVLSPLPSDLQALYTDATHIQIQGSLGTIAKGDWGISTDSDAYISIVPEPASMLTWAGLALVLGIARARRRNSV